MHFDIGKQKVVWILKYKEWDEEATGNALRHKNLNAQELTLKKIIKTKITSNMVYMEN